MFYENLKRICKEKGTSMTAVCEAINVSTGLITHWKNGREPRGTTVIKFATYLGVSVAELLGNTTPTAKPTQPAPQPSTLETVLTPQSLKVAMAYQFARPEIQTAINVLLGIQEDDKSKSERA